MWKWYINLCLFKKKTIIRPQLQSLNYFVDCIAISFNISVLQSFIICFNITVYMNP